MNWIILKINEYKVQKKIEKSKKELACEEFCLGHYCMLQLKINKAIKHYQNALELQPNNKTYLKALQFAIEKQ